MSTDELEGASLIRTARVENDLEQQPQPASTSSSFLQDPKNHIYNSRDFAGKQLSKRQKGALLALVVLLCFLIKALAIDPFRTDKERWERTKELVDEAVKEEVAREQVLAIKDDGGAPGGKGKTAFAVNETALVALEKQAEEFVKREEGDHV